MVNKIRTTSQTEDKPKRYHAYISSHCSASLVKTIEVWDSDGRKREVILAGLNKAFSEYNIPVEYHEKAHGIIIDYGVHTDCLTHEDVLLKQREVMLKTIEVLKGLGLTNLLFKLTGLYDEDFEVLKGLRLTNFLFKLADLTALYDEKCNSIFLKADSLEELDAKYNSFKLSVEVEPLDTAEGYPSNISINPQYLQCKNDLSLWNIEGKSHVLLITRDEVSSYWILYSPNEETVYHIHGDGTEENHSFLKMTLVDKIKFLYLKH